MASPIRHTNRILPLLLAALLLGGCASQPMHTGGPVGYRTDPYIVPGYWGPYDYDGPYGVRPYRYAYPDYFYYRDRIYYYPYPVYTPYPVYRDRPDADHDGPVRRPPRDPGPGPEGSPRSPDKPRGMAGKIIDRFAPKPR
ncbi:hypothetical protein SAMN04488120_103214 [Fontimonas thermophila]|uniref:Lipoprotein n=1 Tax=Fontimonas thermophila TaxID=1076937 RepID=A0A1I2ICD8_9GAMM|nr:hypothetical protein [Fontimonas thermophila]SFF39904.1 hypothetical protein SAMN04488120_103214 [Fontimonas thermophila]